MARLDPLPPEHSPELAEQFASFFKSLGFVPNSVLTMQRNPKLVHAFVTLQGAIWGPDSKVDRGLKRLIAHVASRSAGDAYSMAHTASGALHFGVPADKLAATKDFASEFTVYAGGEDSAGRCHRRGPGAERRHRHNVLGIASTLERGRGGRDRGGHCGHRFRQPLECNHGHPAGR